jgi:2-keto-3-deoxy-6-phosphogluconate aldolase
LGGSWIAPRDLVKKQDWTEITNNARQATEIAAKARSREIA